MTIQMIIVMQIDMKVAREIHIYTTLRGHMDTTKDTETTTETTASQIGRGHTDTITTIHIGMTIGRETHEIDNIRLNAGFGMLKAGTRTALQIIICCVKNW